MPVSAIQIKNVPPEIHERLRDRARSEGRTLGDYALTVLERDLAKPSTREWLDRIAGDEPVPDVSTEDIAELIRAGRTERDERNARSLADRH